MYRLHSMDRTHIIKNRMILNIIFRRALFLVSDSKYKRFDPHLSDLGSMDYSLYNTPHKKMRREMWELRVIFYRKKCFVWAEAVAAEWTSDIDNPRWKEA